MIEIIELIDGAIEKQRDKIIGAARSSSAEDLRYQRGVLDGYISVREALLLHITKGGENGKER